jgi:spermidine synthase
MGRAPPERTTSPTVDLLSVTNPFNADHGLLRLMEPRDASTQKIVEYMLDGSYRKPYIVEDGQLRYLHFSFAYVQSVMRIGEPDALDLRYTIKMMGFLLFQPCPTHVMLLGLGGGSLAKYCFRQLPKARITVVEIDPHVIALRKHFMIPNDDDRFRVICEDGAQHIATQDEPIDVLLVDAFDASGLAKSMADRCFLQSAYDRLAADGVLVMNLAGDKACYTPLLADAKAVFDHQTLVIPVSDDGNHILFAFKNPRFEPDWRRLRARAKELRTRYQLDFPSLVQLLERATRSEANYELAKFPR